MPLYHIGITSYFNLLDKSAVTPFSTGTSSCVVASVRYYIYNVLMYNIIYHQLVKVMDRNRNMKLM